MEDNFGDLPAQITADADYSSYDNLGCVKEGLTGSETGAVDWTDLNL
jgi:hypothetical protein